ncbi:polysaccharide deacetylase family protein [Microbulbifer sp. OS29]|uniref:Polysaccharide deacetylase family protein n=1 Tax=Microbulbifer okhotskensis TaxID=2926617 RepID=A0A9X2ERA6_9GAMM|nr:polysaccharide deacetylase family protein [Microbulbifer okhotskensis]MCO1336952.1 polysaccharide deacetylase family protein [Microbulbifer okhotskensis]
MQLRCLFVFFLSAILFFYTAAAEETNPERYWPAGAQLVISLSMQFEATAQDAHAEGPFGPMNEKYPDTVTPTWYDYGMNEGIPRMLDLWDKHGIKVTSHMVGRAVELNTSLAKEVVQRGHEAAGHGQAWTEQYSLGREEEYQANAKSISIIEKITGQRPVGYNAFGMRHSKNTLDILQQLGFIYHVDNVARDEPFLIFLNNKPLVVVPYTVRNNDFFRYDSYSPMTSAAFLQELKDEFDVLYEEGEKKRRMMSISVHDRMATPAMIKALDTFLNYAKQHKGVAFMRKDEIARWILQQNNVPVATKRETLQAIGKSLPEGME